MIKTVEELLATLDQDKQRRTGIPTFTEQVIEVLAREIKQLKRTEATNKLLIEHEERIRTNKQPLKIVQTLVKFRRGDVVYRLKDMNSHQPGTIASVKGSRVKVKFGDRSVWVDSRSLIHSQANRQVG